MRIMIIKEFKKHNITIPWPIQTEYRSSIQEELKELKETESIRKKTLEEFGIGDLGSEDKKSKNTSEDDF